MGEAIVLLVVGVILIQGFWLAVVTYSMFRRAQRQEQGGASSQARRDTYIEDVFLLHRSGVLLRHLTRRLKPHVDSDILTGMLRVVQEFVRDAFREGEGEEEGELNEMGFGALKVSICGGEYVVLATVVRGERPAEMMGEMKAAIEDLEEKHRESLRDWDGHLSKVVFVDAFLRRLLDGAYGTHPEGKRVKKGRPRWGGSQLWRGIARAPLQLLSKIPLVSRSSETGKEGSEEPLEGP